MIAHHFIVEGGLRDYQQALDYVSNPSSSRSKPCSSSSSSSPRCYWRGPSSPTCGPARHVTRGQLGAGGLWRVTIGYGVYLAVALQTTGGLDIS